MKEKLLEIIKNPANKLIACDLDGVLCKGQFWGDGEPEPEIKRIEWLNGLYKKGAHIIIYTARNPKWFVETKLWLDKYGVMRHGISMMEKIGADCYLDDRALNIDDLPL